MITNFDLYRFRIHYQLSIKYRSLSHGCVRVQNWDGLYRYIIGLDSLLAQEKNKPFTKTDSITTWLNRKERHVIPIRSGLPVYFRYYTAAGKKGKLETYHDVYGEDRSIRDMLLRSLP